MSVHTEVRKRMLQVYVKLRGIQLALNLVKDKVWVGLSSVFLGPNSEDCASIFESCGATLAVGD